MKDIYFDTEANALVISARPAKKERCRCSHCQRRAKYYDAGRGTRRWRALDIGVGKVFAEAPAPRVCRKEHGVVVATVPWAHHDSLFCKSFEEQVSRPAMHTSRSVVSELMRIEWHTVGGICERVYK